MDRRQADTPPSVTYDARGIVRETPLAPHDMVAEITPAGKLFMLAHLAVVRPSQEDWRIEVTGLVERPLSIQLPDLARFRPARVKAVHQCAGSPLAPTVPTRRVACVVWEGVRLRDVLEAALVRPEAQYVWSDGAESGRFEGVDVPFYRKDLPLARVDEDVLLATKLNGEPLPTRHGGPIRLVVPGFYGTNSVKWVWRLTVADHRADGLFTARYYNDPLPDGRSRPVWALAPDSIIVSPGPGETIGGRAELRGWAWADLPVGSVEVSMDGGLRWHGAVLDARADRAWQSWRYIWTPMAPGPAVLMCRAADADGRSQPLDGARNAVHRVEVKVAEAD